MNKKKNVLFVSNVEVPYRAEFFNQLSERVNLTVLYEREASSNRDAKWSKSVKPKYSTKFLHGIKINNEYTFSLGILKYIFSKKYDTIIIGCYNSPSQIIAILMMRMLRKKYILNMDGEYYISGNGIKQKIKRFILRGAKYYIVAGEKASESIRQYVDGNRVFSYHFSSLTKEELEDNKNNMNYNLNDSVLVIGQYFDYKGLDYALKCAKLTPEISYKFIGAGKRSELLKKVVENMQIKNVEVVPFLSKEELYEEYMRCFCLLLPSKQECWGLVINEAASFGCPIISTDGCGAATEFLDYKHIVPRCDELAMKNAINQLKKENIRHYKNYLIEKSHEYSIEKNVEEFLYVINK